MGWPGGWSDATATGRGGRSPRETALGDHLFLNELDQALEQSRLQSGIDKFRIDMYGCLPDGSCQGNERPCPRMPAMLCLPTGGSATCSLGWAYTSFLTELSNNPGITGEGPRAVNRNSSYIVDDQRTADDNALGDKLVGRSRPLGSLFGEVSRALLLPRWVRQFAQNITLTAVDLQA